MENYSLLHARNEISHNNEMIFQASGTLCLWLFYRDDANLDFLRSVNNEIAVHHDINFEIIKLKQGTAEELQQQLLQMNLELSDVLISCYQAIFEPSMLDEFIGQAKMIILVDQTLEIPQDQMIINLSTNNGKDLWCQWLISNIAHHQVEYYDPDGG
jgi:hypothetical protein